jgi:hypothetical protein
VGLSTGSNFTFSTNFWCLDSLTVGVFDFNGDGRADALQRQLGRWDIWGVGDGAANFAFGSCSGAA